MPIHSIRPLWPFSACQSFPGEYLGEELAEGRATLFRLSVPVEIIYILRFTVNTPPAKSRWLRVTAKSRIGRPFGRLPPLPLGEGWGEGITQDSCII